LEGPTEWSQDTNVTTLDQLLDRVKSKQYAKKIAKYHCIVIAVGADDIMKGTYNGATVYEKTMEIANHVVKVSKTKVAICQPPPSRAKISEFVVLNSRVRIASDTANIQFITFEEAFKDTLKANSVLKNSSTLTEEGAKIYAIALCELLDIPDSIRNQYSSSSENESSDETEESCDSEIDETAPSMMIEVPEDRMKHVIGKNGNTIHRIEAQTNTKIKNITWKTREGETSGVMVRGKLVDLPKARDLIQKIITDDDRDSYKNNTKTPCKFFIKGECHRGGYCGYLHDIKKEKETRNNVSSSSSHKSKKQKIKIK